MKPVQILHLTDLHLKASPSWDQKVLLKKLLEDLKGAKARGQRPDIAVFSGDLANAAGDADAYAPVNDYIAQVLNAAGLSLDQLIVCPGNHDADRRVIGPNIPQIKAWRTKAETTRGANELVADEKFLAYVSEAFAPFRKATTSYGAAYRVAEDAFTSTYHFPELDLGIVAVNTASLSGAGLSDDVADRSSLFLPEQAIVEAFEKLPAGGRRIVVGHHPTAWLNDENSVLANRVLQESASVYMCGHLHESAPTQTSGFNGKLLLAQSGALYINRAYWNGYAVISLQENCDESRISFRRWFEGRRGFSKAEDLGDDGTFYSSETARAYWSKQAMLPSPASLETWRTEKLLPTTIADCNNSFSEQDIDLVFVTPEFDHEIPFGVDVTP